MPIDVNLFDANFTYTLNDCGYITSTKDYKPNKINWIPQNLQFTGDITVFTDRFVSRSNLELIRSCKSKYKVAWLVEPASIYPFIYEEIKHMIDEFDLILTHHIEVLLLSKKCHWVHGCGSWINKDNWKVIEKTKKVCIIASNKNYAPGHMLRHEVIKKYGDQIDVFGRGYRPFPDKQDILKDYMFSIEIENCRKENYFTEKLLDCLALGTIPIYWGPKFGIKKFFDLNGFIQFDNIDDIRNILPSLDNQLYMQKQSSINFNLNNAKIFASLDDYVADILTSKLLNA